jgi:hypothetical protein
MFRQFIILLALLPTIAVAQEGSKVSLVSNPFNEVLREAAQVSGARLVGLTATGVNRTRVDVSAMIPSDWKGQPVCLKVVSADGLYESLNAYTISKDWVGGVTDLPYPSKTPKKVSRIPGELISGILLKGDCASRSKEAAPVFWGKGQHGSLRVLLNTARADEAFLTFPDYPEQPDVLCEAMTVSARNAFDTACIISSDLASIDRLEAVAISFKNGEMGQEERITLRLGGASD